MRQDSLHLAKVLRDGIALAFLTACIASGFSAGCSHEPLDISCPDVSEGDLVVTEIHGPQSGDVDQYGEWVEIYNATERSIDITGLSVSFTKLDGSSKRAMFVRSPLSLGPGAYGVFGRQRQGAEPDHVDYGYMADIDSDLFDSAAVEITSCGVFVDLAVYRNLPTKGSLILDGDVSPPTAEANNDEMNWCVDNLEDENTEQMGVRGTPQEENPVCAE